MTPPTRILTRLEIVRQLTELLGLQLPHLDVNEFKKNPQHLINDLQLDSVAFLQLIMDIEKTFHISIANHELDMDLLAGLDPLADLVQGKLYEIN